MIDDKKRERERRYREKRKADPARMRKRREIAKRLKTKYRRNAGMPERGANEERGKRAAIRRLISRLKFYVYCTPRRLTAEQIQQRRLQRNAKRREQHATDAR